MAAATPKQAVSSPPPRVLVLSAPIPLYVKASHLFSTSAGPFLRHEPLYENTPTTQSMSSLAHQPAPPSLPPLTALSRMGLTVLRVTVPYESSSTSRRVAAEADVGGVVAGDEGSVTVNSAFTVSMSLPSFTEGLGSKAEGTDSSHSPSITSTNKSSQSTIRLLPMRLTTIGSAGNRKRTDGVSVSTALMLLDPSSKAVALSSPTARRRSQWRKTLATRATVKAVQKPSPRSGMTLVVVPYHRSQLVHSHCHDRTLMPVAVTANSLIIVQQLPLGNEVVVMMQVQTPTLTPEEIILLFAAKIVALLLLPSALIAWALCRRLLRRSLTRLTHWRRRRQEERLARLEDRAILQMVGGQGLGDSRDVDEAVRLLTDALALATTLLQSSSSAADVTTKVKAPPGSSSSGSGGVVNSASVLGLQHLLAKAHAAAGHLWKADEILRETLRGYRKVGRQSLYGQEVPAMKVADEEGMAMGGDDGDECIAHGEDDGLVEAGALEDLGVVLWRQAQQAHHRITTPRNQNDDAGGEEWATGGGELSAEGLRLLEEAYDMLMAALQIYEREMIEQLSSIDPEAVRAMYKARLEAAAVAAAASEMMSISISCGDRDGSSPSMRSRSPTSLTHVHLTDVADDSDDDNDYEAALRDLEESLFARADDRGQTVINTISQPQPSKPRLTLATASSEGTATFSPSYSFSPNHNKPYFSFPHKSYKL